MNRDLLTPFRTRSETAPKHAASASVLLRSKGPGLAGEMDRAIVVDGLFSERTTHAIWSAISKNRPIDADSRWNRADSKSAKFPFEIKSVNF
jgi:hypothetical protein